MTPDQIAIYLPVCNSHGPYTDRRNVRYPIEDPAYGWRGFVRDEVAPMMDEGVRMFELHNPGGVDLSVDDAMHFSQMSRARTLGLNYIHDFVPVFGTLIESTGIDMKYYSGSAHDTADVKDRRYVEAELAPQRESGCCWAIDSGQNSPPDSLDFWYAQEELKRGRTCAVEGTAKKEDSHWWPFDQLNLYRSFYPRHVSMSDKNRDPNYMYPQIDDDHWYGGTTYVLFRTTVFFKGGRRPEGPPDTTRLTDEPEKMVQWWNEIRERAPNKKIVPMTTDKVLLKLLKFNLLKDMAP